MIRPDKNSDTQYQVSSQHASFRGDVAVLLICSQNFRFANGTVGESFLLFPDLGELLILDAGIISAPERF